MARKKRATLTSRIGDWWSSLTPSPETRRGIERGLLIGLALVLVTGGLWIALRVKKSVESNDVFFLDSWQLDFQEFPTWMTSEIQDEILDVDLRQGGERVSLFEQGVLTLLRKRLEESPWVYDVSDLRLRFPTSRKPGVVEAKMSYRRPVAVVEAADGYYYLTDWRGMRLGEAYDQSPSRWFGVPVIRGAPTTDADLPAPGQYWGAREVLEGVAVANVLYRAGIHHDFPGRPIECIDVSNVGGRLVKGENEIVLLCHGLHLEWGRSSEAKHARPLDDAFLVKNLRGVLAMQDLRALRGRRIVLYYERPVSEPMRES